MAHFDRPDIGIVGFKPIYVATYVRVVVICVAYCSLTSIIIQAFVGTIGIIILGSREKLLSEQLDREMQL